MGTMMVTMKATDGSEVQVIVPTDIPSNERADTLRTLYDKYVQHPGGHWKGEAIGICPADVADDVADAMDFMGSPVDIRSDSSPDMEAIMERQGLTETHVSVGNTIRKVAVPKGYSWLYSKGYWAHGF